MILIQARPVEGGLMLVWWIQPEPHLVCPLDFTGLVVVAVWLKDAAVLDVRE